MLMQCLERATAHCAQRQARAALLFVDLDRFKDVNDLYGHEVGDRVLVEVARRLRAAVPTDDVVARNGGDEFVVLLADVASAEDATAVAHKIRAALSECIEVPGASVLIGACIGIASCPEDGQTPNELMRSADAAMYAAKLSGRNTIRTRVTSVGPQAQEEDVA
jgi:diguanylate cyclase (GGDEF)-like protein